MTINLERLAAALGDRYPIERELGHGGMARVYLAHDVRHRRPVAVKVLRPELAAVVGAERFLREIEIAAQLSHPHILPLYDSGQAEGLLYYVMPLVDGESLRTRLDQVKQLPVEEAVRLAQQVASALDHAHRRGIVHRDIKPENILLHEGEALVADFGIALAVRAAAGERLTETGLSLGTPFYMSPEQATGDREIDARSDVYSLGCVLYEMLAGEPPFAGPTAQAVVARILTEQPRALRTIRSSVPPALERVVGKALSRLPADRYDSAARFSEALGASLRDTSAGTALLPALRGPRSRRLARALPWVVAGAALLYAFARPGHAGAAASGLADDEITLDELRQVLAARHALVLDTRPHLEYSVSHVPGALNVAARPGVPLSMYVSDVAEVRRIAGNDLHRDLVLYCNGPFCPKSKRLEAELKSDGFTSVKRFQLGIPVWRAFGGETAIEPDGLRYVLGKDGTAAVLDTRDSAAFQAGSLPGARWLPRSRVVDERDAGEIRKAKDDGRLPMLDHNTRVIVVGATEADAHYVAQALVREAFHNVAYFPGTFEQARAALAKR